MRGLERLCKIFSNPVLGTGVTPTSCFSTVTTYRSSGDKRSFTRQSNGVIPNCTAEASTYSSVCN